LVVLRKHLFFWRKYFFLSSLQKFLQLKKYSRWKINIQSIFGQHKILYKKIKKNFDFEKFNHHIKSKRRRQHINIDSNGILKQSESVEAPHRLEVMGPISIQVSSAILQDQVTFFCFYLTYQI
jgi:hypothetical protein